jgi:alkylation response protein AidB-like acyl-CoA dehydrogenase
MEFRFDDDQLAMRDAVRVVCGAPLDPSRLGDRDGEPADPAWWRDLAGLGVLGMLAPGSGTTMVEASLVFEELGAQLAAGPVLWSTLAAPDLPSAADGGERVTGLELSPGDTGPFVIDHLAECDRVLLLRHDVVTVVASSELSQATSSNPFDPLTPVAIVDSLPSGEPLGQVELAGRLRRQGAVLAAAMLVGIARAAMDVARAYALERRQFGAPIGSFQAVKHLLADMYVRTELAQSAVYAAAAVAAGLGDDDVGRSGSRAKVLAGEAATANARSSVQILGGMGFTWDMLPHYLLKRSWMLEHTFGTSDLHATALGTTLGREVQEVAAP